MVQVRHHGDEETVEVNVVTEKLAVLVTVHVAVGREASAVAGTGERRLLVLVCFLMQVPFT